MTERKRGFLLVNPELLVVLAPLLWTLAGVKLALRAYFAVEWFAHPLLLLCAFLVGLAKSLVVLDRLVQKNVKRLDTYSGKVFIGCVFPARTWCIIGAMILLGRLLRYSSLATEIQGFITLAVAVGLLMASRLYWYRLGRRHSRCCPD